MINMSHCRFENTAAAFNECKDALQELESGDLVLSASELDAAKLLLRSAAELLAIFCENGEADTTDPEDVAIHCDAVLDGMQKDAAEQCNETGA